MVMFPGPGYEAELEQLYSRRCALDALIASLEEYDQLQKNTDDTRRTA